MKLGILVTIISGFGKKGFYHSQEIGLGKALAAKGHDVTVYKCLARDKHEDDTEVSARLRVRYFPIPAVGVHGLFDPALLDRDLDGLLVFSDTQIFLPRVYRWCVKNKVAFVPYVGIAHSAWKKKVMDLLFRAGTLRVYRKLPVIAKSPAVKDELRALGVERCEVAPVGLDETELKTDYASCDREALRREMGYGPDDVVIGFVGRLKVEKQPEEMIDLFGRIKDRKPFRLLMVGEGYLKEKIEEKITASGLTDRVRLIERVPYEDMWKIHVVCDYFVNLCTREIFGMALLESVYYRSSAAALHAPGPDVILKDLPGHALCGSMEEIEERLCGQYPDDAALAYSSEELLRRFSWNIAAGLFIDITEGKEAGTSC
ncbi:MAG: glycosyltransferase [Clostridia bacterium]|nr:glycosyltransferase [Clostridia bacterium]